MGAIQPHSPHPLSWMLLDTKSELPFVRVFFNGNLEVGFGLNLNLGTLTQGQADQHCNSLIYFMLDKLERETVPLFHYI